MRRKGKDDRRKLEWQEERKLKEEEREKRNKKTILSNMEKEIIFFLFKQDVSSLMNYLNIY